MNFNIDFSKMSHKQIHEYILNIEKIEDKIEDNHKEKLANLLLQDNRKTIQKLGAQISRMCKLKEDEVNRVRKMYEFDRSFGKYRYVAGVDEVGRGPLAGPIVGAAVILDLNIINDKDLILKVNDSKKLSIATRKELSYIIKEKALAYSIISIDNNEIDKKGIAFCNNQVFLDACDTLTIKPDLVLSDGYKIKNFSGLNEHVIKGDTKSISIACASIIAKVYRDEIMVQYNDKYPNYGFNKNVGYGTEEHVSAIKKHGIAPIHRKNFLKNIVTQENNN